RARRDVALAGADDAGRVADRDERVLDTAQLLYAAGDLLERRRAALERVAFRRLDRDLELALVVARQEVLADHLEERDRRVDRHDGREDDHPAVTQRPLEDPAVAAVDPAVERALLRRGVARLDLEEA